MWRGVCVVSCGEGVRASFRLSCSVHLLVVGKVQERDGPRQRADEVTLSVATLAFSTSFSARVLRFPAWILTCE